MKAILFTYVCGQNEPSPPIPKVFDLPNDSAGRQQMMEDVFVQTFDLDVETPGVEYVETPGGVYGDAYVTYEDELFVYATFIEE